MAEIQTGMTDPFVSGPTSLMESALNKPSAQEGTDLMGPVYPPSQMIMAGEVDRKWKEAGEIRVELNQVLSDPAALLKFIDEYSEPRDLEKESEIDSLPGPKRPLAEAYSTALVNPSTQINETGFNNEKTGDYRPDGSNLQIVGYVDQITRINDNPFNREDREKITTYVVELSGIDGRRIEIESASVESPDLMQAYSKAISKIQSEWTGFTKVSIPKIEQLEGFEYLNVALSQSTKPLSTAQIVDTKPPIVQAVTENPSVQPPKPSSALLIGSKPAFNTPSSALIAESRPLSAPASQTAPFTQAQKPSSTVIAESKPLSALANPAPITESRPLPALASQTASFTQAQKPSSALIAESRPLSAPANLAPIAESRPLPAPANLAPIAESKPLPAPASQTASFTQAQKPSSTVIAESNQNINIPSSARLIENEPLKTTKGSEISVESRKAELKKEEVLSGQDIISDEEFFKLAGLSTTARASLESKKEYDDYEQKLAIKIKASSSAVTPSSTALLQQEKATLPPSTKTPLNQTASLDLTEGQVVSPSSAVLLQKETPSRRAEALNPNQSASSVLASGPLATPSSAVLAKQQQPASSKLSEVGQTAASQNAPASSALAEASEFDQMLKSDFSADDFAAITGMASSMIDSEKKMKEAEIRAEENRKKEDAERAEKAKQATEAAKAGSSNPLASSNKLIESSQKTSPSSIALAETKPGQAPASEMLAGGKPGAPSSIALAETKPGQAPASEMLAGGQPASAKSDPSSTGLSQEKSVDQKKTESAQVLSGQDIISDEEFFKLAGLSTTARASLESKKEYDDYEKTLADKIRAGGAPGSSAALLNKEATSPGSTATGSSTARPGGSPGNPSSTALAQSTAKPTPASTPLAGSSASPSSTALASDKKPTSSPSFVTSSTGEIIYVPPGVSSSAVLAEAAKKDADKASAASKLVEGSDKASAASKLVEGSEKGKESSAALSGKGGEAASTALTENDMLNSILKSDFSADDFAAITGMASSMIDSDKKMKEAEIRAEENRKKEDAERAEKAKQAELELKKKSEKSNVTTPSSAVVAETTAAKVESAKPAPTKSSEVLAEAAKETKAAVSETAKVESAKPAPTKSSEVLAEAAKETKAAESSTNKESPESIKIKAAKENTAKGSDVLSEENKEKSVEKSGSTDQSAQVSPYTVQGEAKKLENGKNKVILSLVETKSGDVVTKSSSSKPDVISAYNEATEVMVYELADLGLFEKVSMPDLSKIEGASALMEKGADKTEEKKEKSEVVATPTKILDKTTKETDKAEEAKAEKPEGFWSKINSFLGIKDKTKKSESGKEDGQIDKFATASPANNPNLVAKFSVDDDEESDDQYVEPAKELNISTVMNGEAAQPNQTEGTAQEKMNNLAASNAISEQNAQEEKSKELEEKAAVQNTDNVSIKSSAPAEKAALNNIANPPNPLIPEVQNLSSTVRNTSSEMTSAITQKLTEASTVQASSAGSSTITNNINNLSSQMTQPGIISTGQTETAQPAQQMVESSGLSEYYLQAIYEALIVQGVKLRTI